LGEGPGVGVDPTDEQIIEACQRERDDVTLGLFQRILGDERKHQRVFADLLAKEGAARA